MKYLTRMKHIDNKIIFFSHAMYDKRHISGNKRITCITKLEKPFLSATGPILQSTSIYIRHFLFSFVGTRVPFESPTLSLNARYSSLGSETVACVLPRSRIASRSTPVAAGTRHSRNSPLFILT